MQKKLVLFAGLLFVQPLLGYSPQQIQGYQNRVAQAIQADDATELQKIINEFRPGARKSAEKAILKTFQDQLTALQAGPPPGGKGNGGKGTGAGAKGFADIQKMDAYNEVQRAADKLATDLQTAGYGPDVFPALINSLK